MTRLRLWLGGVSLVGLTAIVCFAISATTGSASGSRRIVRVPLNAIARFPGVDLDCTYAKNVTHLLGSYLVRCDRTSEPHGSLGVVFTSFRVQVMLGKRILFSTARIP